MSPLLPPIPLEFVSKNGLAVNSKDLLLRVLSAAAAILALKVRALDLPIHLGFILCSSKYCIIIRLNWENTGDLVQRLVHRHCSLSRNQLLRKEPLRTLFKEGAT